MEMEVKKELRSTESWFEQLANIVYSICWGLGTCLSLTAVMIGSMTLLIILTTPETELIPIISGKSLVALKDLIIFTGIISATVIPPIKSRCFK